MNAGVGGLAPRGAVLVPRSHLGYACERTLVCCHEPTRAPLGDDELPRVTAALTAAGAVEHARGVAAAREQVDATSGPTSVVAHHEGRCVHLRQAPARCELHALGGLDALGLACRNYPRLVTRMPDGSSEVAFNFHCPTASRLLVADPRPLILEPVDARTFPFPPSREAPPELALEPGGGRRLSLSDLFEWRRWWWRELSTDREDPLRLLARLARLHVAPFDRDPVVAPTPLDGGAFQREVGNLEAWVVCRGLERLPERGATYEEVRWPVRRETAEPMTGAALMAALAPVAPMLHALLDHTILLVGLHDGRALSPYLTTAARRAVLIARFCDALCHRTPFRLATLMADLFSATALVEPLATP